MLAKVKAKSNVNFNFSQRSVIISHRRISSSFFSFKIFRFLSLYAQPDKHFLARHAEIYNSPVN